MHSPHLALVFSLVNNLKVGSFLGDDPLGSPESYLKYDIKKGASLDPDYEAVGILLTSQHF